MSDTDILRPPAARQATTDPIFRYCRAIDRLDRELGCPDFGSLYRGSGRGRIESDCEAQRRKGLGHALQITNVPIELTRDSVAREAHRTVRRLDADKSKQFMVWRRGVDKWPRREGREVRVWAAAAAQTRCAEQPHASHAAFNVA
jgi:hypothetical protein